MDFETRYKALNAAQKQAVDTVDGPLMVVAGPGTGKTELLSMRVANILRTTDALPQNILCLTYTESGATAMRERLAGLIGPGAYKVAIHTFHSFGSEIINYNGDYFYNGAHFRPADELSSYEVLRGIFEKLPHNNPLATTMNDDFTYLRDTQSAISDLKKAGLTSDELLAILERNEAFTDWLQPRLQNAFGPRLSKKSLSTIGDLLDDVRGYEDEPLELITYEPLSELVEASLGDALNEALESGSTKPISAWKRDWCEKRDDGELTLKDAKRSKRLRAVAGIYYDYLLAMQARSLYDFDDMILRAVHALDIFTDLRLNLQEQYQYILVDEFQDTNDAQMRLLWNLTNNLASEGRPNVMIVGDDDQAIYRFQGANLSNILNFRSLYTDVATVTLTDNYRSAGEILEVARQTITQANERLEHSIESVDKTLTPHYTPKKPEVSFTGYGDEASEYSALASRIAGAKQGDPTRSIAVIARHHRQLQTLAPYLQKQGIPLKYDRRDNVLDSAPVVFLELLARIINLIAEQDIMTANGLLPQLLAHPAWGLEATVLWKLGLQAHSQRQLWIEVMLEGDGKLHDIANWLLDSAVLSLHQPLEYIIDHLTGTAETQVADSEAGESEVEAAPEHEGFYSPLRDYFFAREQLAENPSLYISYLDALTSIRRRIREYRPEGQLQLRDFIYLIDKYRELGIGIQGGSHIYAENNPVELLTAHRSKGLEYDSVYVIDLADSTWGETARSRGKLISYPHNLPIGIGGDSSDEHIRLLFVALTRAKSSLHLSYHQANENGKALLPVGYLSHLEPTEQSLRARTLSEQTELWHAQLGEVTKHTMSELLRDTLEKYKLSATHLGNYLDVSRGGPELFLLQNLLRFPQAMSPSAAFGSSIHAVLQRAHAHLSATGKRRPIEDLLGDFESSLSEYQLARDTFDYFLKKGSDTLNAFFAARYDGFTPTQRVEQNFSGQGAMIGEARLSGAIDLMDINETTKTIVVTDYKTGKCAPNWKGRTEYEKIKLHHYRQQLLFYKLLIENSREYAGYTVEKGIIEFVEADQQGGFHRLELAYEPEELAEFSELIQGVWRRIQSLQFQPGGTYGENLAGILAFEQDILAP